MSEKKLKLKSSDGRIFTLEERAAVQSEMLKLMVEDNCAFGTIPMPNVDSRTLAMVIDFCKRHADPTGKTDLEAFDAQFVDKDQATLFDLLMAANYLNIPGLLDKLSGKIADMIKGKSPEEIRQIFNIKNDFTQKEEEEIRRENGWAFE
ncbi:SKP1-like protein 1A [Diospyros lotus]|uniref:SKP1-like protein 1A n=1 Tax=Diospyros lotus TaxID=55363 RepID=UPI00224D17AD|nr:SKP1-like protein 1A [Diospyros lotus]